MKLKKRQELRSKTIKEIESLVQEAETQLVKLRMEKASSKLKDTTVIRKKRKEIAIMKTILREKQQAMEAAR